MNSINVLLTSAAFALAVAIPTAHAQHAAQPSGLIDCGAKFVACITNTSVITCGAQFAQCLFDNGSSDTPNRNGGRRDE